MPILNLKEIFKTSKRFSGFYRISPKDVSLPADLGDLESPVEVEVEIEKTTGGYSVKLRIKGEVKLECSRCLTPFIKEIESTETIRLERFPQKASISLRTQDLDVCFLEDEESFDLAQLVREQIILSIPTKPLCSVDCQIPSLGEAQESSSFASLKHLLQKTQNVSHLP
ncbi:YceD family protein [Thermocrinis sp.]